LGARDEREYNNCELINFNLALRYKASKLLKEIKNFNSFFLSLLTICRAAIKRINKEMVQFFFRRFMEIEMGNWNSFTFLWINIQADVELGKLALDELVET
jgi:hypothetical protein